MLKIFYINFQLVDIQYDAFYFFQVIIDVILNDKTVYALFSV